MAVILIREEASVGWGMKRCCPSRQRLRSAFGRLEVVGALSLSGAEHLGLADHSRALEVEDAEPLGVFAGLTREAEPLALSRADIPRALGD